MRPLVAVLAVLLLAAAAHATSTYAPSPPCRAYDVKSKFDFSGAKDATFLFYESTLDKSFYIKLCSSVYEYTGGHLLTSSNERFYTRLQGEYFEFVPIRNLTVAGTVADEPDTWPDEVNEFHMNFHHGSYSPPCDQEEDKVRQQFRRHETGTRRQQGFLKGRTASIHITCQTGTQGCNGEASCPESNQPKTVDPVTNEVLPANFGCICSASQTSTCSYQINMVYPCPTEETWFNLTLRQFAAFGFFLGVVLVALLYRMYLYYTKRGSKPDVYAAAVAKVFKGQGRRKEQDEKGRSYSKYSFTGIMRWITARRLGEDFIPLQPPNNSNV